MSLQEKLDRIKYQLVSLATISEEIRKDSNTIEGREKIMAILERHKIFESPDCFYRAMHEIYKEHDPEFRLPRFQNDCYGVDWIYTEEYDYLLLKITTSKYYGIAFIGFNHLLDLHKKHTETHTRETTYKFIMNCVWYIESAARKMLTLPIFNANQLIFLSLMQHYYVNCDIEVCPGLEDYIIDSNIFWNNLGDDFKRMVFETNGSDPLSVRGSLPVITYYARKKALGHGSDSSHLAKDMRSNKALNLRKAFDKMESYLGNTGNTSATVNKRIDFDCVVGVETEHYTPGLNRIYGLSDKPVAFFTNRLRFGIFGSCRDPRRISYGETYVGWTEFNGEETIYDRFKDLFNCLEDDVVGTLEDNYNFLLEKLPVLEKERLRNDMLGYIMEGF